MKTTSFKRSWKCWYRNENVEFTNIWLSANMKLNQPDNRRLGGKSGCRQFPNAVSETCKRIITNSKLFIIITIADFSISKKQHLWTQRCAKSELNSVWKKLNGKNACYQNEAQTVWHVLSLSVLGLACLGFDCLGFDPVPKNNLNQCPLILI